MRINLVRVDKYCGIAGTFLFVSAFVIYHGSHRMLLEFYQEHHQQLLLDPDGMTQVFADEDENNGSCNCNNYSNQSVVIRSTCSEDADRRGLNQSVVSYSLFGRPHQDDNVRRRYFSSIEKKAARIARYYPGWIMRVYHNLSVDEESEFLCPLRCRHRFNVDLCHVDRIRNQEISAALIQRLNPRMWRFLVMLDPLVDWFISRDMDSEIIPRETAAVKQWLNSNYTFHVMRDHPSHGGFMLAGLWGAKNVQRRDLIRRLGKAMIWASQNEDYETDQSRLDFFVWPFASFDVMAHDAYFCNNWALKMGQMVPTFPFPTRRIGHNYTGLDLVRLDIADHILPCPVECRPANHKNWRYC